MNSYRGRIIKYNIKIQCILLLLCRLVVRHSYRLYYFNDYILLANNSLQIHTVCTFYFIYPRNRYTHI